MPSARYEVLHSAEMRLATSSSRDTESVSVNEQGNRVGRMCILLIQGNCQLAPVMLSLLPSLLPEVSTSQEQASVMVALDREHAEDTEHACTAFNVNISPLYWHICIPSPAELR